jgi:hypothetical protein
MTQMRTDQKVRKLRRPEGAAPLSGRRLRANWPGEIRIAGEKIACTVRDVSSGGASLTTEAAPEADGELWLVLENVGPVPAALAWRENNRVGIRFLKEQDWVLQLCNQRFNPAAWLKTN